MPLNAREKRAKKRIWMCGILGGILLLTVVFLTVFSVREVTVEGNSRYTEAEIEELVLGKGYSNTLLLALKSRFQGFSPIPFISTLEINVRSAGHVSIRVYEKMIVGYVEYMGTHLYFDKDGIVVESYSDPLEGVPLISGLKFSEVTLYEPLPVKDEDIFRVILNLTQSLDKNAVYPDKIAFTDDVEITLYFNEARVLFGTEDHMDEKIANLAAFVDDLKERKGVLHMENFTDETSNIVFDGDDG